MNIYDRNGKPMSPEEFEAIPQRKRVLKQKTLILKGEPILVRTMWDGEDMSHGEAPVPCPFSALVWSESYPNMMMATPDEKRALVAHEMMVGFVRAQGGRSGWRVPFYFASRAFRHPTTIRVGWINLAISVATALVQLAVLVLSAITGNWSGFSVAVVIGAVLYTWWAKNAIQGLKEKYKERSEERRAEKERKDFENIVGPLR